MDKSLYQQHWDMYATATGKANPDGWPGDEWGTEEGWQRVFELMFARHGVAEWKNCVEIGGGAGKYTLKVLQANNTVRVMSADISPVFQSYSRDRLTKAGVVDRVEFVQLDLTPSTLMKNIRTAGLAGKLDAFYSIDAMVHVDLQHLIVYLITSAVALRKDGKLIMTLANSASDDGFNKLVRDARSMFRRQHEPTAKFEWMSLEMVKDLIPRLGFEFLSVGAGGRFIHLVAAKNREPDARLLEVVA